MKLENRIDRQIDALVGALTDPIITWPSPWMETIPESLKSRVPLERMVRLMKGDDGLATDVEALIYMYPRTLEAPLDRDWTEIYLYLGTKVMGGAMGKDMPEDIKIEKLTEYQERHLNELKRWIRERQQKVAAERRRTERAQAKAEAAAKAPAQLGLGM